jgi:hypothetical protein
MIRLMLPDAHIIHCRRHAVDTCLSCYTKLFAGEQSFAYDQTELGRFHCAYQALMAHWRAILPASHFLEAEQLNRWPARRGRGREALKLTSLT